MKRIKYFLLLLVIVCFSIKVNSQLWKQYSDTASAFSDQKKVDKAIEYYYKALDVLKKDSAETNSYARICNSLAALYTDLAEFTKAESFFLQGKQIRAKTLGKQNADYAASCNGLAVLYSRMGEYQKAELLFLEAKQIREKVLGKEHPDYATSCDNLAILYKDMGQYIKSEALCLEAIQIREKVLGKENPDYALSCNNLANLYLDLGQYEKAEPFYLDAKRIKEKILGKENFSYASTCNNLGRLYFKQGHYEKAEPLYFEARQIKEKILGKNHPTYATTCNNLADLYRAKGQYEKAEPFYLEAKDIRAKSLGQDNIDYSASCHGLAVLYWKMGQYKKAEPLFVEAKNIREKKVGKESLDYTASCEDLANLYRDMGQYEEAEPLFLEAKQSIEKTLGREHSGYASVCNDLAVLYRVMGRYEKAEVLYLEAKQIREKTIDKDPREYASSCNNLANLYYEMNQNEKAEPLFIESKDLREKMLGKEHPDYAESCNNLANLYHGMNQYKKAESLLVEARQIWAKVLGKDHPAYASSCSNLAVLYDGSMGQHEKAEPLYLEAKHIMEKALGREHPDYAINCLTLANLYRNMNKPETASDLYREAFQLQNNGVKKIFQFTSEVEQLSYLKTMSDFEKYFLSFNNSGRSDFRQGFAYNVSISGRNLILTSSQQLRRVIYNITDTSVKKKYDDWISSREQLAYWYAKPVAERPVYAKDAEERANTLEKELTRLSSAFRKKQSNIEEVSWKNIQQSLKPGESAIEFVEFDYYNGNRWTDSTYYIALLLRKDKPEPQLIRLFEKKQLDLFLNNKQSDNTRDKINDLYTGSNSLYNLVWKPLERYLKGITKIYFAPAGDLFKLSLGAMPVNDKQLLGDRYRLVQLNSTANVVVKNSDFIAASDKIQLYGGIKYDEDPVALKQVASSYQPFLASRSLPEDLTRGNVFRYLDGSKKEVEEIKKMADQNHIPATVFSGSNAIEESFKALNGVNSPSVLLISTHGFFFRDPNDDKRESSQQDLAMSGKVFKQSDNPLLRSGLAFAGANNAWRGKPIEGIEDGILTAYEVSNMYLPNTKLVVLSACETGLGDIQGSEGVYGLQRSFKMAGVQNLIMSLWKVPDEATSEFMKLFFQNMFNKQSISDAFYHAQTMMKNKYRNNPYNWAAWVLVR